MWQVVAYNDGCVLSQAITDSGQFVSRPAPVALLPAAETPAAQTEPTVV